VTTNAADCTAVRDALAVQTTDEVQVARGFYATVAALAEDPIVLVANVGVPDGRSSWQLAELRRHTAQASVVVVADATLLPDLMGTLRADLAVTSVRGLPPISELALGGSTGDPVRPEGGAAGGSRAVR
jgi:hypothetical protein